MRRSCPVSGRSRSGSSLSRRPRRRPTRDPMALIDAQESAKEAGLHYTTDEAPGIRRVPRGKGFTYTDRDGRQVDDEAALARIRKLAIPPAWTDVWICPSPNGHLQATGRDARGRKQYRYHERWREVRDENKFERIGLF